MELQDYISRHEVIRPPVETQSEVDRIVDGLLRLIGSNFRRSTSAKS